ncbi:ABC transporter permease subunit [Bacillus sp. JCM 19041]|uniref:ABC transporter permease n=1 Tax=Bacillus sp. JCM 19041 TaxID=1460637 RepID=UPI0006D2BEF0
MIAIIQNEFFQMMKSIKAIVVLILFIGSSYFIGSLLSDFGSELEVDALGYSASTLILVFFFGFLFVLLLSHDYLNGEMESGTIRLLIVKLPRKQIILGKVIAIHLFWLICLVATYGISAFWSSMFDWQGLIQMYAVVTYAIGICSLLTVLIRRKTTTMIISLALGILIPAIGIWQN